MHFYAVDTVSFVFVFFFSFASTFSHRFMVDYCDYVKNVSTVCRLDGSVKY